MMRYKTHTIAQPQGETFEVYEKPTGCPVFTAETLTECQQWIDREIEQRKIERALKMGNPVF